MNMYKEINNIKHFLFFVLDNTQQTSPASVRRVFAQNTVERFHLNLLVL